VHRGHVSAAALLRLGVIAASTGWRAVPARPTPIRYRCQRRHRGRDRLLRMPR